MARIGGSIKQITLNGRQFSVKSDVDISEVFPTNNKVEMNGDQTATLVQVIEPWRLNDIVLSIDNENGDREFIRDAARIPDFWPITFTTADSKVYGAVGQIVDAPERKTMNNSVAISLSGPGDVEVQ
jgi:hypothetical protein